MIAGVFSLLGSFSFFGANADQSPSKKDNSIWLGIAFLGITLIYVVRSYFLLALIPIAITLLGYSMVKRSNPITIFSILLVSLGLSITGTFTRFDDTGNQYVSFQPNDEEQNQFNLTTPTEVQENSFIYSYLNLAASPIIEARAGFNTSYPKASSAIDTDVFFSDYFDVLRCTPRAVQIALFSPFPTFWFSSGEKETSSIFRFVATVETIFFYTFIPAFFLAIKEGKNSPVTFLGCASIVLSTIICLSISNLGAIYRFRFPFHMIMLTIGLGYFFNWLSKRKIKS